MIAPNHAKPYALTFEQRVDYLYAYIEGEHDNYEISRAYWLEIAGEVARTEASRVLIDENLAERSSMADVFKVSSEIPQMGFGPTRIAFVDRYLNQSDVNQFGEIVAVNRGLNGKIFNEISEAEAWLLSQA